MRAQLLIASMLLLMTMKSIAMPSDVCEKATKKLEVVIEDWHSFVKAYNAETKNPSVLAMHKDFVSGSLNRKLTKKCNEHWETHADIYTCFSGITSELGAAMCLHPDTNKNDWKYHN